MDVNELVVYDPESGEFMWKVSRGGQQAGSPAGHINKTHGYVEIQINGVKYYGHQLAFLIMTGEVPDMVDHRNRIRHDNRWDNLRESDLIRNRNNSGVRRNNKSGEPFVSWDSANSKWRVRIKMGDTTFNRRLDCFDEAVQLARDKVRERDSELFGS